jgi:hypothetical protein
VNDGNEKLITINDFRTSVFDELVSFGYVIFTSKDGNGQPIITSPQTNKIYLFNPSDSNVANDQFEEWIYIDSGFELIGTTQIELNDYYDKDETDDLIQVAKQIQYYPNTKNTSGSLIPKGAVVQFAGSQGDFSLIKQAVASEINANPSLLMGLAYESIADNAFGDVVYFGNVLNVATGSFTIGQILWFDTVNGGLTATEPATNKIQIAAVQKASSNPSATNGILLVRVKYVSRDIDEVDGLTDALAGKSAVGHTHPISDVVNLQTALNNLQDDVDGKLDLTGGTISGNLGVTGKLNTVGAVGNKTVMDIKIPVVGGANNGGRIVLSRNGNNEVISSINMVVNDLSNGLPNYISFNTDNVTTNTERMRITSTGNVGIGTTSPNAQLSLGTNAGSAGQPNKIVLYDDATLANRIGFGISGGQMNMVAGANTSQVFYTNGANERLRITSAGLVGINQPTPTEQLDVVGNIKASGTVTTPSVVATSTVKIGSWTLSQNGTSGSLDFVVV